MFNVLLDEDNYYTGVYAKVGKIEGGVEVDVLPPYENSLGYKLVEEMVETTEKVPILQYIREPNNTDELLENRILDESQYSELSEEDQKLYTSSYATDNEGNLLLQDISISKLQQRWEYNQERFEKLESQRISELEEQEKLIKSLSSEQQRADIDYIALMSGIDLEV